MSKIVEITVLSDEIVGQEGGFLGIRRLRLRNRRADGSLSEPYLCDYAVRPFGLDAVVVALYRRVGEAPGSPGSIEVLLRHGLRPPLIFGRTPDQVPVPDSRTYLTFPELVAGIVERSDTGLEGVRHRGAEEAREEAGYAVKPEDVVFLGASTFPTPGVLPEKFWFLAADVTHTEVEAAPGDGSPMEEGIVIEWMELDAAIAACMRGDIEDCKTELGLRRLKDWLQSR